MLFWIARIHKEHSKLRQTVLFLRKGLEDEARFLKDWHLLQSRSAWSRLDSMFSWLHWLLFLSASEGRIERPNHRSLLPIILSLTVVLVQGIPM